MTRSMKLESFSIAAKRIRSSSTWQEVSWATTREPPVIMEMSGWIRKKCFLLLGAFLKQKL